MLLTFVCFQSSQPRRSVGLSGKIQSVVYATWVVCVLQVAPHHYTHEIDALLFKSSISSSASVQSYRESDAIHPTYKIVYDPPSLSSPHDYCKTCEYVVRG